MLSRVQGVLKPLFILFLGGRGGGAREGQAAIHIMHKNIFRVLLNICPPHRETCILLLQSLGKNPEMTAEKDFLSPVCPNGNSRE